MLLFCHFPLHQRHFLLWLQLLWLLFFKGLYQCHGVNASWVTLTSPHWHTFQFSSVQSLKSCLTLCDPMNRSTPGLPVHHQLPEFTPTHIHRVGDAIQPSHPLSSPSPPAPNSSQHQSFPMSQLFTGQLKSRQPRRWGQGHHDDRVEGSMDLPNPGIKPRSPALQMNSLPSEPPGKPL